MSNIDKVSRLVVHLDQFIELLHDTTDLRVHEKVSQFYYMQKSEELKILQQQLIEAKQKLALTHQRIDLHYREIYQHWCNDQQWLKQYTLSGNAMINGIRDRN